jgi:hypothetical protein
MVARIHPEGGLLVIDVVGLRSMYFVVMPRVNLIVILMTYVRYLYSINCPTIICLPSMLLFILRRDTTSELWTPVQFLYIAITIYFYSLIYFLAYYYLLPLDMLNPLFIANRWDWQPHRKLGQSTWLCCVQVPCCYWCKAKPWTRRHINCPSCREASEHQPSEVWISPTGSINLGFTTERRLAAVLIIPSSWGSQRGVIYTLSRTMKLRSSGKKEMRFTRFFFVNQSYLNTTLLEK